MKRMLSIACACLVGLTVISTGKALAAEEIQWSTHWTPTSVRVYRTNYVHVYNEDGTYRPTDYTDVSISGHTMNVSGYFEYIAVDTMAVEVTSSTGDITEIKQTSLNGTRYNTQVDLSKFKGCGKIEVRFTFGDSYSTNYDWYRLDYYNILNENGKWTFKHRDKYFDAGYKASNLPVNLEVYWQGRNEHMRQLMIINPIEQENIRIMSNKLCQGVTDDLIKAKIIYEYVTNNFPWGQDVGLVDGISSARRCDGLSQLCNQLLHHQKIPSLQVTGNNGDEKGFGVARHGWCEAYINGRWVMMDPSGVGHFDLNFNHYMDRYEIKGSNRGSYKTPDPIPVSAVTAKYNLVNFQVGGFPTSVAAYNINDNNYIKLRDIAKIMSRTNKKFSVNWDNSTQSISMKTGANYVDVGGELYFDRYGEDTWALKSTAKVYLNGKELNLTVYNIDNNNYFKLRDIAEKVNFGVKWNSGNGSITLNPSSGYVK